jgi:hypothetical protein
LVGGDIDNNTSAFEPDVGPSGFGTFAVSLHESCETKAIEIEGE